MAAEEPPGEYGQGRGPWGDGLLAKSNSIEVLCNPDMIMNVGVSNFALIIDVCYNIICISLIIIPIIALFLVEKDGLQVTTKLYLYIFALIGTIIKMILLTYENIPENFQFNYIAFAAAIFILLANHSKKGLWKGLFYGISLSLLIFFVWYGLTININISKLFGEYAPFWLLLIVLIGTYRNYMESKDNHRKELIYRSEAVMHIVTSYERSQDNDPYYLYKLWLIELERAYMDLMKEILASNLWSDFSLNELWLEIKQWADSKTRSNSLIDRKYKYRDLILCKEMKIAAQIANEADEIIAYNNKKDLSYYIKLQEAINEVKETYLESTNIANYNIDARYSN